MSTVFFILTPILVCLAISNITYNYLSGRRAIADTIHLLIIKNKSLKALDQGWVEATNRSDIIISMTTIPDRIEMLDLTIKSLLYQQVLPAKIYLFLPYASKRNESKYEVPTWLINMKSVEIVWVEKDFGPATKFIPAIERFDSEQSLLIADDDIIYPPKHVMDFTRATREYPGYILTASGWRVPADCIDWPTTVMMNIKSIPPAAVINSRTKGLYEVDIVEGYGGFLIKPKYFDLEQLKDYGGAPPEAWYVDDIWISAHAKTKKAVVPMHRFCYRPLYRRSAYYSSSLSKINKEGRTDYSQLNNSIVMKYFRDRWRFIDSN